jgi:hypothetical protein
MTRIIDDRKVRVLGLKINGDLPFRKVTVFGLLIRRESAVNDS